LWGLERDGEPSLAITGFERRRTDPTGIRDEIVAEGERLMAMLAPDAEPAVRFR
jgi:hypothetical protein